MEFIISESQLMAIKEYENGEVMRHQFTSRVKNYIDGLLKHPENKQFDKFFSDNGIGEKELQQKLIDLGILKKEKEGFNEPIGSDGKKYSIHYKKYSAKNNDFDNNMRKLYDEFFQGGKRKMVNEDGEGGSAFAGPSAGGATNAAGMGNLGSGQYDVPFGGVVKRKIGGDITKQTTSTVDMTPALKRKNGKGGSISINTKK